ncbi:MAG: sigma-70 family RNA polymerase sigma factor [Gemmataceae bacterium]
MNDVDLADLATSWSLLMSARQTEGDAAAAARNTLLLRYCDAVVRFLRVQLRDEHAVDELCSNFAVRILEADGLLQRADPQRGRFRDYLKTVLRNMIADYHRKRQRQSKQLEALRQGDNEPVELDSRQAEQDREFANCWRQEIIKWAWQQLEQTEKKTGQPYATLLRLQETQSGLRSAQLAELLTEQLCRPFTASGVRQLAHRGRELFGDLLVAETARSLQVDADDPDGAGRVEQELIDLNLLFSYCKKALERCCPAQGTVKPEPRP